MSDVSRIIEKHSGERGELIAILEDIQAKYSYLPEEALRTVAERTGRSLTHIYGVATFYRWFSLAPRGKHLLTCCVGTACHVRGAPAVAQELERALGVRAGATTADRQFTLETQNCLGGCALGPTVVADGHYFPNVSTPMVFGIIRETAAGGVCVNDAMVHSAPPTLPFGGVRQQRHGCGPRQVQLPTRAAKRCRATPPRSPSSRARRPKSTRTSSASMPTSGRPRAFRGRSRP